MKRKTKNAFTLVELLAVIVILAIILVIAVPKVMSVIEDSKKATLESTAKMIASAAEKQKVQNTVLGNSDAITCDSVAKINKGDYASCDIEFEDNTAKVTIQGKGKFDNLWVCEGTKTNATAQKDSCSPEISSLEVKHPLFFSGQELTPDKFVVTATYKDGSTRILEDGTNEGVNDNKAVTVTSPNWPNNYPINMTEEENTWEYTFEGAVGIQVTFDETSSLANTNIYECEWGDANLQIMIYEKDSTYPDVVCDTFFAGRTYTYKGDYIKIVMISDDRETDKGFSAIIKPIYILEPEYSISPSVVPNSTGNFDMTININGSNINKKITTSSGPHNIEDYILNHNGFDTMQENATYTNSSNEEITINTGIRYKGKKTEVKNKVYFNCEPTDGTNTYGSKDYKYNESCEIWSIVGAFDTEDGNGNTNLRTKIVNAESTFEASWDSSLTGKGINQWGQTTYKDSDNVEQLYLGADIMQLLNGYYIGESTTCGYNIDKYQAGFAQTCTSESLKTVNMNPLTNVALNMIDEALWRTYGISYDAESAEDVFLQENGIITKYNGCFENRNDEPENISYNCEDQAIRINEWTGLVGLMSASDVKYSGGWMKTTNNSIWLITPQASGENYDEVSSFDEYGVSSSYAYFNNYVFPSVYLKPGIKVISGNGDTEPYILAN